ncbi:MAG: hypothetical protein ABIO70_08315 [Pseudomonadota bacterium]
MAATSPPVSEVPLRPTLPRSAWLAALCALPACECRFEQPDSSDTTGTGDTGEPWVDDGLTHTWSFLQEGLLNDLLPLHVAVDSAARRAYAFSLKLGTIAVIDLDQGALLDVIDPGYGGGTADLTVLPSGTLWVLRQRSIPALIRIDLASGDITAVETGLGSAAGILRRPDGSFVVTGSRAEDDDVVQFLDADLNLLDTWESESPVRGIVPVGDDRFAILYGATTGRVNIYDIETLEQLQTCVAPVAGSTLTQLSDGNFVSASDTFLGLARCDGHAGLTVTAGTENKSTVPWGDGFFVFDRIGTADPNWAEARFYDASMRQGLYVYPTGKNSGYAALDSQRGLAWVNSEGTTEVLAMDLDNGDILHRVRVGVHLESVAGDPDHPWRVFVTGRLSNTLAVADLRDDSLHVVEPTFDWPVAPTVQGGDLWVLDQLTARLHRLSGRTLEELGDVDLGWPADTTLTISDMKLHPERGTLFVTHGGENALAEVDPSDGGVLHTWKLGGEPLDRDAPGRLELVIGAHDVYTVRCYDGQITRIDPDQADPISQGAPLIEQLSQESRMQMAALSEDEAILYLNGVAISTATLERDPTQDHPWTVPLAEQYGYWLAWRDADTSIVVYDPHGQPVRTYPVTLTGHPDLELRWMPWSGGRVAFTDLDAGVLTAVPVEFPPQVEE